MYDYSPHKGFTRYTSLLGRVVFITGGSTGIGASLVEAFTEQDARVAFVDVDSHAANELCDRLVAQGKARPWFKVCDVSKIDDLKLAIAEAAGDLGSVSVLVNNAANDMRYDTLAMTEAQWHESLDINLHPVFFAAQAVQPMMAALGGGSIINISSLNTQISAPNLVSYIAAKAGILGISRALATDFGGMGIRVNSILPGWVATPKQLEKWLTPEQEMELMKRVRLKKRLGAHDISKLALFLASDDSAMITAQELVVDGGRL